MSNYKHEGQHLNRQIAEEIVKNYLDGTGNIARITELVLEHHTRHGGLPPDPESRLYRDRNIERSMRSMMLILEGKGYVKQVSDDLWEIYERPLRVFGEGSGAVYVYYSQTERVANHANHANWVCKVGSHHTSEIADVRKYVDSQTTNWSRRAILAVILKTDTYKQLESQIGTILRDVFDRKHERDGSYSREMFYTSPDQVIEIYEFIRSNDGRYV